MTDIAFQIVFLFDFGLSARCVNNYSQMCGELYLSDMISYDRNCGDHTVSFNIVVISDAWELFGVFEILLQSVC